MPCCEHIRCSEQVGEAVKEIFVVPAGTITEDDGLSSVVLKDCPVPVGYCIECFIPGDTLPVAAAFVTGAFKGVCKSVRMVHQLLKGKPFAAHGTAVPREIGIAFYTGNTSVLNMDKYTATAVAAATITSDYLLGISFAHELLNLSPDTGDTGMLISLVVYHIY
jgi:hypothetical protein